MDTDAAAVFFGYLPSRLAPAVGVAGERWFFFADARPCDDAPVLFVVVVRVIGAVEALQFAVIEIVSVEPFAGCAGREYFAPAVLGEWQVLQAVPLGDDEGRFARSRLWWW